MPKATCYAAAAAAVSTTVVVMACVFFLSMLAFGAGHRVVTAWKCQEPTGYHWKPEYHHLKILESRPKITKNALLNGRQFAGVDYLDKSTSNNCSGCISGDHGGFSRGTAFSATFQSRRRTHDVGSTGNDGRGKSAVAAAGSGVTSRL